MPRRAAGCATWYNLFGGSGCQSFVYIVLIHREISTFPSFHLPYLIYLQSLFMDSLPFSVSLSLSLSLSLSQLWPWCSIVHYPSSFSPTVASTRFSHRDSRQIYCCRPQELIPHSSRKSSNLPQPRRNPISHAISKTETPTSIIQIPQTGPPTCDSLAPYPVGAAHRLDCLKGMNDRIQRALNKPWRLKTPCSSRVNSGVGAMTVSGPKLRIPWEIQRWPRRSLT